MTFDPLPCDLPSELISAFRESLAQYEKTGVTMEAPAVRTLCKTLLTIQEITRDLEEDYGVVQRLLADRFEALRKRVESSRAQSSDPAGNIVAFKPRLRTIPINNDGGDAA